MATAVSPELVLLSEPLELLSESDDDDESEPEDEEESESEELELELSCLRLLRGAGAPSCLGWSSGNTSLGSRNFGRNCTYGDTLFCCITPRSCLLLVSQTW